VADTFATFSQKRLEKSAKQW